MIPNPWKTVTVTEHGIDREAVQSGRCGTLSARMVIGHVVWHLQSSAAYKAAHVLALFGKIISKMHGKAGFHLIFFLKQSSETCI